jgi:GTPase SAR1 family protein
MSTKGGNNFDWDKGVDKFRIFERFRSKVRHNKNVILVKLKGKKNPLFKETIFTFRKFVNMSYVPVPILFTGDFDYDDFEKDLESFNSEFTTKYGQKENNIVIHRGIVDKTQKIDSQKCFYIKQDASFSDRVKNELKKACYYHNFKDNNYNGETLNIAVIGLPRSGKSLFTNTILNKLSAKVANDMISVTQGKTSFSHSNVENIPIRIIDTPGFEDTDNSVPSFINWLLGSDKDNSDKKRIDNIHVVVYFINAKNFPNPKDFGNAWTDSAGISRSNEFYLEEEISLFKIFKDNKVPVVFVIAQSYSFENGYKYLKKWFGDLALINELSNYQSNEENWDAENQWICPVWTRGCLIQLKNDPIEGSLDYTGKYGFVKLMNIIEDLFISNVEYRNRLPDVFQLLKNLKIILNGLKKQLITQQGFIDDASNAPVCDKGEDLIVREVDKKYRLAYLCCIVHI